MMTTEETSAFAQRLVLADKAATAIGLKGFWKDLARETLAATTHGELDTVGRCVAGYNRTKQLEKHPEYQILVALGKKRREEIKSNDRA